MKKRCPHCKKFRPSYLLTDHVRQCAEMSKVVAAIRRSNRQEIARRWAEIQHGEKQCC